LVSDLGIDHLISISVPAYATELSGDSDTKVHEFSNKSDALLLLRELQAGDVLLVKASRAEHFEEIAQEIVSNWQTGAGKRDDE